MLLLEYDFPLEKGKFLKRYKRFFADIIIADNEIITVHCANSGSMKSCLEENTDAYILDSKNAQRKLKYSLELLDLEDGLACLNTARANSFINSLLAETISKKQRDEFIEAEFPYELFLDWDNFKKEVKFTKETRFDFCLFSEKFSKKCWIEVKSVSLKLDQKTWAFPDAVTERGQKHLVELMSAVKQGDEAWLFFVLMRGSKIQPEILRNGFRAAEEIDLKYAQLLREAQNAGVKIALIIPSLSIQGFGLRKFYLLK